MDSEINLLLEASRALARDVQEEYAHLLLEECGDPQQIIVDLDFLDSCYVSKNLNEIKNDPDESKHTNKDEIISEKPEEQEEKEEIQIIDNNEEVALRNNIEVVGVTYLKRVSIDNHDLFTNSDESFSNSNEYKLLLKTVEELVTTEIDYLKSVYFLRKGFIQRISRKVAKEDRKVSDKMINLLKMIYRFGLVFLDDLTRNASSFHLIGTAFINNKELFYLYAKLSRQWLKYSKIIDTEDIRNYIQGIELYLKEPLGFSRYIVKPLQRLGKYELFLHSIQKQLKRIKNLEKLPTSHPVEKSSAFINHILNLCNTVVAIETIEFNPYNESKTGNFLLRENLTQVIKKRNNKHKKDVEMFLFEKFLILAINIEGSLQFTEAIAIDNLRRLDSPKNKLRFVLEDFVEFKLKHQTYQIVLEAATECSKQKCVDAIDKLLWSQLVQLKDEVSSRYSIIVSDTPT